MHPGDFAGRRVLVIGAGQSALENAALLHEHGAIVQLVARGNSIVWHPPPHSLDRSSWQRLRRPVGGLCTGMGCWLYEHAPLGFHALPQSTRLRLATTTFGPAGAWWLRDRVDGHVPVALGRRLRSASVQGAEIELVVDRGGQTETFRADHVISATGYRVDLNRLEFLDDGLRGQVRVAERFPELSRHFESNVRGLYFVGSASTGSFGPLVRFVLGARFTARTLQRRFAGSFRRRSVSGSVASRTRS